MSIRRPSYVMRRLALALTPRPLRAGGRRRRFAVSLSRRVPALAEPRSTTAGNLDLDPHPERGREEIVGFCIDFHKKAVVITACVRGSPPFGHLERSPMRLAFRTLSVLAFLLLAPVAAHAQASITGVVKDASGAVLPGVTVEVASPALIEKVRTGTTDSTGQYRIINLVPGTYSVTFTLTGFGTTKREDIELTGSFTATVNADLKVGGVAETITVSGETPIVDTQSVRRQTTLSGELLTSVPTARSWAATALLIPGIVTIGGGPTDVQVTPQMTVFGGAGGRNNEGRMQVDGLNAGAGLGGSGVSTYVADISNAQEVVTTTSGGLGEVEVGGPTLSIIPRSGGNTMSGNAYLSGVGGGMVGSNYTDRLKNLGLTTPGKLLKQWDFTFGMGGPIIKDRLWYRVAARDEGQHRTIPGVYPNL